MSTEMSCTLNAILMLTKKQFISGRLCGEARFVHTDDWSMVSPGWAIDQASCNAGGTKTEGSPGFRDDDAANRVSSASLAGS